MMHCGVAQINLQEEYQSSLFFGDVWPVITQLSRLGIPASRVIATFCWLHSGFVQATKIACEFGCQSRKFRITAEATSVFPAPVGRQTRQLLLNTRLFQFSSVEKNYFERSTSSSLLIAPNREIIWKDKLTLI
jgi:hypothetical protein